MNAAIALAVMSVVTCSDCPMDCDCESDIVDCSDAEDMENGRSRFLNGCKLLENIFCRMFFIRVTNG